MSEFTGISVSANYNDISVDINYNTFNNHFGVDSNTTTSNSYTPPTDPLLDNPETKAILEEDNISHILTEIGEIFETKVIGDVTVFDMFDYLSSTNPLTFALKKLGKKVVFNYFTKTVIDKNGISSLRFKLDSNTYRDLNDIGAEIVDIINDLNSNNVQVNDIFNCDGVFCELFELAFEEIFARKLGNAIDDYKSNNQNSFTQTDDTYTFLSDTGFLDIAVDDSNIFSNSTDVKIEIDSNDNMIIETTQSNTLNFSRPEFLPESISTSLKQTGDMYIDRITEQNILTQNSLDKANQSLTNYNNAPDMVYKDQYYVWSDDHVHIYNPDKPILWNKYVTDYNAYVGNFNKGAALNNRKRGDILDLLKELVYGNGPCMSPEQIVNTVENAFGDVLVDNAVDIAREVQDEKKIETDCCITACCNPCDYKLVQ